MWSADCTRPSFPIWMWKCLPNLQRHPTSLRRISPKNNATAAQSSWRDPATRFALRSFGPSLRPLRLKSFRAMNILVLGRGKTGSLVVEIARERGHEVSVLTGKENPSASALTPERLSKINVVLDFTTPEAVLDNILACIRSRTNIVVGTTGWYKNWTK